MSSEVAPGRAVCAGWPSASIVAIALSICGGCRKEQPNDPAPAPPADAGAPTVPGHAEAWAPSALPDRLFPFRTAAGKSGYIDRSGKVRIEARFENAGAFHEGVAIAAERGAYGFIDLSGRFVVPAAFEEVGPFADGLAPAKSKNGKVGYIDRKGGWAIDGPFAEALGFSAGLAAVRIDRLHGYIDRSGKVVIPARFYPSTVYGITFAEDRAAVALVKDGLFGYIDRLGRVAIAPSFDAVAPFSEGLAAVGRQGKGGYVDRAGKVVIMFKFARTGDFSGGLAPACTGPSGTATCGYIDRTGTFTVQPKFTDARPFAGDLAPAAEGGRWGYVNRKGAFVIPAQFEWASPFEDGVAAVDFERAYIDDRGKVIFRAP